MMRLHRALSTPTAVSLLLLLAVACGSEDKKNPGAGGSGSAGSGSTGGSGGSGGTGSSSNTGGTTTEGCSRFDYKATGEACPSTGCSFRCDCPDDFPVSIASCTPDGCLYAADCTALCAEGLEGGFECIDTYTVEPRSSGGTGGGATGGAGGMPPQPTCEAEDVALSPASVSLLGNVEVTAQAMITDASGNQYIAGVVSAKSEVDFDTADEIEPLPAGKRLFLLKLDASGAHVWSRRFGSDYGIEGVSSLSFDQDGDILMGGITSWETDLGGGPEPVVEVPQHYAVRYDTDGNFVDSYLLPTSNSIPTLVRVVEQPNGEVHFWGNFYAPFSVGETTLDPAGTTTEADIFVVRFSAAGEVLEAKQYGDTRNDLLFDVVTDASGNSYLLGFSFYKVDFGKDPIDIGNNGLSFVVRLDSTLTPVWQKLVGSGGSYPRRGVLDGTTLIVAGDAYGGVYYGASDTGGLGEGNVYVLRIDTTDGSLTQGKVYETLGFGARLQGLSLLPNSGVVIAGRMSGPGDFGGGEMNSERGPFIAAYDAAGDHLWSTLFCSLNGSDVTGVGYVDDSALVTVAFTADLELGSTNYESGGSVRLDMPAAN